MFHHLTIRQRRILEFIRDYIRKNGFPPTIREIGKAVGLKSLRGVTNNLEKLEQAGCLKRGRAPRAIQITAPSYFTTPDATMLPILGSVPAGPPTSWGDATDGYLAVPTPLVRQKEAFLLRVQGDSMRDAGILPRDLVLVLAGPQASSGDIVVARVDGETTVKKIRYVNSDVMLIPENEAYAPLRYPREQVEVIGKVVGLFRDYQGVAF